MIKFILLLILFIVIAGIAISWINIVPQAHAFVVERFGTYQSTWNPGLHFDEVR